MGDVGVATRSQAVLDGLPIEGLQIGEHGCADCIWGLLKKSASGVLGPLSGFALTDLALFAPFAHTYSVYASGAKAPAALLVLAPPKRLRTGERAFLNRPLACDDSGIWADGIGALKILIYSTVPSETL